MTPPPHEPDERHENRGREERKVMEPLLRKGPMSIVAAVMFIVAGGGVAGSHSVLGGQMKEQTDTLNKVQVTLAEIKGKLDASESTGVRCEKGLDLALARLSLIETKQATLEAQIQALKEKKAP